MLTLKCRADEGKIQLSRASLLNIPQELIGKKTDVALVSGHGLTLDTPCWVQDFEGNSRKVLKFKIAKNYKAGTDTDWGLIYFDTIPTKSVIRYPLLPYKADSPLDMSVQFAAARGLPVNSQSCELKAVSLKIGDAENAQNLLTHNCRAIAGQSGTPVTLQSATTEKLIGFHMGHLWMTKSPISGRPNRLGYIRPFDQAMIDDIKAMLRED